MTKRRKENPVAEVIKTVLALPLIIVTAGATALLDT